MITCCAGDTWVGSELPPARLQRLLPPFAGRVRIRDREQVHHTRKSALGPVLSVDVNLKPPPPPRKRRNRGGGRQKAGLNQPRQQDLQLIAPALRTRPGNGGRRRWRRAGGSSLPTHVS